MRRPIFALAFALALDASPAVAQPARDDVARRFAAAEQAAFGSPRAPSPEMLTALDEAYDGALRAWFLGRGQEVCERLGRAAALARGVAYDGEFARTWATRIRVEPPVVEPGEEARVVRELLYVPGGGGAAPAEAPRVETFRSAEEGTVPLGEPWGMAEVHVIRDFRGRLGRARAALARVPEPERSSLAWAVARLESGAGGSLSPALAPEGPVRYLEELRALEAALARTARGEARPLAELRGDTLQAYRDARGKLVPYRLYVPREGPGPFPLVIALHGATANEHMWFEMYGGGKLKHLAGTRGYAVASPRLGDQGLGGFIRDPGAAPGEAALAALEAVAAAVPIDRARVFVIGHSMGGMLAIEAAGAAPPGTFRAVAAIAGVDVRAPREAVARTPLLLAWGAKDLLAQPCRAYAKSAATWHPNVEILEIDGAGHVLAVPLALERVFDWVERWGTTGTARRGAF